MANVKNRSNTSNVGASSTGSGGRSKKSLGVNNTKNAPTQVKKSRKSNMQPIGNKVNDDFIDNVLLNKEKLRKDIQKSKKKIISNGRVISKHNLKLFNKILKNELQIEDKVIKNNCNNNDLEITDQNVNISLDSSLNDNHSSTKDSDKNGKTSKNKNLNDRKEKRVMRKRALNKNLMYEHIYECDYCRKRFTSKCSLRRHMYLHADAQNCTCSKCNKVFRNHVYLSSHIKRQHPNWDEHHMCKICDKPFLLEENLKLHLTSHTRTEKTFKCIYCKEEYSDQTLLIQHEKQHLVSGRYQCIICEMDFDCRNRLTKHFKSHLRVKDYICQYCGKEFLRLNSMRRHVQVCHAGIRIQCPICNKYLKGHLTEHMRTHEKKRPHECPDCGQRFTQSTQLNVHRRSHTGARPYPCRICGRPFTHSNALMLHIRRHTGEKPFECAMCPLSFSQLPHMKAHMKNIHGKEKSYKCDKCYHFFKLKIELENHVKNCVVGQQVNDNKQQLIKTEDVEVESVMSLSRMRFLIALLLTMIATKEKLKYLGFNKRLIDDLVVESIEAMGHIPCKDEEMTPLTRLRTNISILLNGTVPKQQMEKFKKENKSTEELLELLTDAKKNN